MTFNTQQGNPVGLTGATGASRYVGATASGAPASGTFAVGDFVIDQTGTIYICTVAGTPGTWVQTTSSGGPPTGNAGGDLTGTYPNPTVGTAKITLAQQANVVTNRIIGRGTAGTGVEEALVPTGLYLGNSTVMVPSNPVKQNYTGQISANGDPINTGIATLTLAAATVYLSRVPLPGSGTSTVSITNICAILNTIATSTLTHSFGGVLTSAGVQVGITADNSSANANWSSTGAAGFKQMALVGGPFTVTPTGIDDFVYCCLYIGTTVGTAPKFQAYTNMTSAFIANLANTAATSRCATQAVADTATPFAALTMSSNVATAQPIWMGVS